MKQKIVHLGKQSLKRVLGVADLFAVGYGDVGSSIYYALGITALYAMGATPIALGLAALVFICTALTYAEMSTTFPEPGGSATFSRYAFNDLISFIAGWGLLLDYILTIAISAFAVPPYLKYIFNLFSIPYPESVWFHIGFTITLIIGLFIINLVGVRASGRFSLVLAIITILSQAFVIILGTLLVLNLPYIWSHMRIGVADAPSWPEFWKGTAMAMVAYTGIEAIAQLAAETKKTAVVIPRAIKMTMYTLITMYLGISVVGLSVISPHDLGTKYINDPVAGIVAHLPFGGAWLAPWFGLIAAIILLIAANAGLLGCSRLLFSMGEYYQVPRMFYKIHARFRTPYLALLVFTGLSILIVAVSGGEILFLADLYNFGAQIAFFSAHMSLLVLRWKKPSLPRPYKAPLNIPLGKNRSFPLTAIIGALGTFGVWLIVVVTKPDGRNLGFTWVAFGIAMFLFYRKKKKMGVTGHLQIENIKIPDYEPMELKNILIGSCCLGNSDAMQTACQLAKNSHAKITAVFVIEVPIAMPMHAPLHPRVEMAKAGLKRAEAIAREYDVPVELKVIRARNLEKALQELSEAQHYDLVIVDEGPTKNLPTPTLFFNS